MANQDCGYKKAKELLNISKDDSDNEKVYSILNMSGDMIS